ncbi:MAG: type IV secretory system conjugative DNA transfer family protein [Solirubrobacteraceae bacterium]
MSMSSSREPWGPSHEYLPPPGRRRGHWKLGAIALILVALELLGYRADHPDAQNALTWTLHTLALNSAILALLFLLVRAAMTGRLRLPVPQAQSPATRLADQIAGAENPGEAVRAHSRELGGGAFLGFSPGGRWVTANPEHAVMLLGPPRSGKTTSVVIPSLLAAPGAALSTSTKRDVIDATWRARSQLGQVWLFDPSGEQTHWPQGIRKLCWSPVAAATTWDQALLMARAMSATSPATHGTRNEHHWTERSAALLAPLLYAANLTNQPIATVLRWVLRGELNPAGKALENNDAQVAGDVLIGIAHTDERERSSIFSATAGILAAYNADTTRRAAAKPNFDAERFAASTDTVYITAPAHKQNLAAPLVVGLLEQIRHATYQHATHHQPTGPPVFFCLDEIANIAPIHDLPALISEAGGQHLHILACLQDLSQARTRWGQDAADGFLSLFQTKLILTGIADSRTLEAISLALGEYDRHLVSHTISQSTPDKPRTPHTHTDSVTYNTQRQRTLNPGDIARLPPGHGLLLHGTHWGLLKLTPWQRTRPWTAVTKAEVLAGTPNHSQGDALAARA